MTGSIDDCNLDAAQVRQHSDQKSLTDYSGGTPETFVSIVHSMNDDMERATDEHDDRLAPDNNLFSDWIEERDERRSSGHQYVSAHNSAFNAVNYRDRFITSLDDDVIEEYAERVRGGDRIVLCCYCSNGCYCHRKIVKEKIHEKLFDE